MSGWFDVLRRALAWWSKPSTPRFAHAIIDLIPKTEAQLDLKQATKAELLIEDSTSVDAEFVP